MTYFKILSFPNFPEGRYIHYTFNTEGKRIYSSFKSFSENATIQHTNCIQDDPQLEYSDNGHTWLVTDWLHGEPTGYSAQYTHNQLTCETYIQTIQTGDTIKLVVRYRYGSPHELEAWSNDTLISHVKNSIAFRLLSCRNYHGDLISEICPKVFTKGSLN